MKTSGILALMRSGIVVGALAMPLKWSSGSLEIVAAPGAVAANHYFSSSVSRFVDDYRRMRLALRESHRQFTVGGQKAVEDKENRARVFSIAPEKIHVSLADVLASDPLSAVDLLLGIAPFITSEIDADTSHWFQHRTVHFLLRSPMSQQLEQKAIAENQALRPADRPLQAVDLLDFFEFQDPRVAAFRELSRDEIYRRVIARLPEVGQEKMFGVLVAMFQFDPWLAATTIDELAETGELPVKRPADAKPTAAQRLRETIESSRDILVTSRVWSRDGIIGSGTLGPLLPMALEFAGDRWWIRAALAREMEMEKLKAEEAEAYSSLANRPYSPLMSARDALMNDPHPVVRYVVFNRIERNGYEESLADFRKIVKGARLSDPESPQAQRAQSLAELREGRQRTLESRLGKPITEIPEPPKE